MTKEEILKKNKHESVNAQVEMRDNVDLRIQGGFLYGLLQDVRQVTVKTGKSAGKIKPVYMIYAESGDGEIDGKRLAIAGPVEIWGGAVLDSALPKVMGSVVMISYEGKKMNRTGTNEYDDFKVEKFPDVKISIKEAKK